MNSKKLNEKNKIVFKAKNDPRITRLGSFYRKSSIDELPQVINVLKNEMSFVGPRPPIISEVKQYELKHLKTNISKTRYYWIMASFALDKIIILIDGLKKTLSILILVFGSRYLFNIFNNQRDF